MNLTKTFTSLKTRNGFDNMSIQEMIDELKESTQKIDECKGALELFADGYQSTPKWLDNALTELNKEKWQFSQDLSFIATFENQLPDPKSTDPLQTAFNSSLE